MTRVRRPPAPLAWIVLLAAFLRLWNLPAASFFHYDEGDIAKVAMGPAVAVRWAARTAWEGGDWSKASLKRELSRYGYPNVRTAARPGYLALSALSMTVLGVSDLAMIAVSALAGTATVWLLHRLLAAAAPGVAALGALALAVSPTHVFFSRTGFAHATAGFFLLLAVFLCLRPIREGREIPLFRAGLAAGFAFTCHFNVAWAAIVLAGILLARSLLERGAARAAGEACRFAAGAAAPILLFQAATYAVWMAAERAGGAGGRYPNVDTYLDGLREQQHHLVEYCDPKALSVPGFYLLHWLRTEGPGMLLGTLAGAALAAAAFRRGRREAGARWTLGAAALCLAVSLAAVEIMTWKVARTLVPLLPFGAILWAGAFGAWRPAGPRGRALRWGLVALSLLPAAWRSASYLEGHGHFRALTRELTARGVQPLAVDEVYVVDFYAARIQETMPRDWTDYERIRAASGRPCALIALWKSGEYGFQDPVYANRFGFVRDVLARKPVADRILPFAVPLDFEHVDRELAWSRLWSLSDVRYEVHVFDLEGIRR